MKLRRIDENGTYFFGVPCRNDETKSCYNELETFIEMGFSGATHEELKKNDDDKPGTYLTTDDEHGTFFLNALYNGEQVCQGLFSISSMAHDLLFDKRYPNGGKLEKSEMLLTNGKRTSQKNVAYFPKVGKLVLSFNSPEHPLQGFEIILQVNDQIKVQMADKTLLSLKPATDKKVSDSFSIHFFNEETGKGKLYKSTLEDFLKQKFWCNGSIPYLIFSGRNYNNFIEPPETANDELLILFDFVKCDKQEYKSQYHEIKKDFLNFDIMISYKGKQYKMKSNDFFFRVHGTGTFSLNNKIEAINNSL